MRHGNDIVAETDARFTTYVVS